VNLETVIFWERLVESEGEEAQKIKSRDERIK